MQFWRLTKGGGPKKVAWIATGPGGIIFGIARANGWGMMYSYHTDGGLYQSILVQTPEGSRESQKLITRYPPVPKIKGLLHFYSVCGYWFTVRLGFEGMRATPQIITEAMQLYFTGESFRGVKNFLKLRGVKFSHQAVYNWVEKYTLLMEGYLEQIKPQLDDTWRTDELYVKVKGNMKYLFAMMDDETRFRIAQQIATNKGTDDVRPMFREAMEVAGKKPKVLISDGAPNFHRELSGEMQKGAVFVDPEGILNGHILFYEGEVKDGTGVIAGKSLFADYIDSSTGEVRSISPTVMWDLAEGNKTEREDVDVEGLKNRVLVNIVNDET